MKSIYIAVALLTFVLSGFIAEVDESRSVSKTAGVQNEEPVGDNPNAPNVRRGKMGFSMRLQLDNRGVMGKYAYGFATVPQDSIGLEYPLGQRIEHLYGAGVWIGGKLDTAVSGPPQIVKLVSTAYEGWGSGGNQLVEFFPGDTQEDSLWRFGKNTPKPANWDSYWGNSLPFQLISDNDVYCTYTDTGSPGLSNHRPMKLKVIQSAYAWQSTYADGIIIVEYKIINQGAKLIDSSYVGVFSDCDVGPVNVPNYFQRNFTAYNAPSHTAYTHNPIDRGSTPMGVTLLYTSGYNIDSLRYSFQWYPGPQTPATDAAKYDLMSIGGVKADEYPNLSDTRFLFSFGPFSFKPTNGLFGTPDTFKVAVALISGFSRRISPVAVMLSKAARALDIYLNQGLTLPKTPPSPPLHVDVGFRRVTLDWRWTPADSLVGFENPEENWDSTNTVANRDPRRIRPPYPYGWDSSQVRGGRNFEAYKLWRSEVPRHPDESFTLLGQWDDSLDQYEYNTGLNFTYVDSNLVRGKTYVYSVTSKSIPNQVVLTGNDTVDVDALESSIQDNATVVVLPFAVSNELGKVSVVPNPYRTDNNYTLESGGWEGPTGEWNETLRLIKFINLPTKCTIRMFTLSGDLVREVDHDGSTEGYPRGDHDVPLLSQSNRALASGIYIFTVESEFGTQTGKFVVIR